MNESTSEFKEGTERWQMLFESFRLSISLPCLTLALFGTLLTAAAWRLDASLCSVDTNDTFPGDGVRLPLPIDQPPLTGTLQTSLEGSQTQLLPADSDIPVSSSLIPLDPVWGVPRHLMIPVVRLFQRTNSWSMTWYYLIGGIGQLAIWAFFGGAISRHAIVYLSVRQRTSMREACDFSRRHWIHFFGAPALPIAGVTMMALPIVVLGVLMRLDMGVALAGILWIFVLAISVLMSVLAIGLCFGWPLMWGTISAEDSDSLDAISRCYAYTYQRPLHYLAYALAAAAVGLLGWYVAWIFTEAVIQLAYWGITWGAGSLRTNELLSAMEQSETTGSLWLGTSIIALFQKLVRTSASAFSYSYFWSVTSAIYLLLRYDADQTPLDEVAWSNRDPLDFSLPHLEDDANGVAGIART